MTPPPFGAAAPSSPSSPTGRVLPGSDSLLDDPGKLVPAIFTVLAFLTVIGLALPWLQPDLFSAASRPSPIGAAN